jgi:RHS repeat-associated protein
MDMRIAKIVYEDKAHTSITSTYYTHDAQGNIMATYTRTQQNNPGNEGIANRFEDSYTLNDHTLYGSSRLGTETSETLLTSRFYLASVNAYNLETGYDANGNFNDTWFSDTENLSGMNPDEMLMESGLLQVVTDRKVPFTVDGVLVYSADVVSYSDYSPYGVELDGRYGSSGYRYGYQGSEKDDEVKGGGNSYTTEFRFLDPRLGRWLSIDPVDQPWQSTYCSMDNNPIVYNDIKGLSVKDWIGKKNENGSVSWKFDPNVQSAEELPEGYTEYLDVPDGEWMVRENAKINDGEAGTVLINSNGEAFRLNDSDPAVIKPENQENSKPFFSEYTAKSHRIIPRKQSVFFDDVNHPDYEARKKSRANCFEADDLAIITGGCAATGVLVYVGIASAPVWIPALGNFGRATWQGTKWAAQTYNRTFGVNGGYMNMAYNYGAQSMSTGSLRLGNKNLFSLAMSGFIRGTTPLVQQSAIGASSSYFNVTLDKGFQVLKGSNAYKISSILNGAITPFIGGSKYANGLSSTLGSSLTQTYINIMENGENWDK